MLLNFLVYNIPILTFFFKSYKNIELSSSAPTLRIKFPIFHNDDNNINDNNDNNDNDNDNINDNNDDNFNTRFAET
jgi:hypothetical protein